MKKQKTTYSLTAKERKALRRGEAGKVEKEEALSAEDAAPLEGGEAVAAPSKTTKKQIWILVVSIVLGLLIILLAILLPFIIKQNNSKYPRAVIELEDGRKIEMVLWEEDCPIAATNFIFLAKIGFFDGTLFYDVHPERNFMRIGNFTGYGTTENKTDDQNFLASIPQSMLNVTRLDQLENGRYVTNANVNKLGYYLQKDVSSYAGLYRDPFVVSYHNDRNAADFVINLGENNENFQPSVSKDYLSAFASIEDAASQQVLLDIMSSELNPNTGLTNIQGTRPAIRIRTVTVSNLNKKKWKNFEFISYMQTAYRGSSAIRGWVGSV